MHFPRLLGFFALLAAAAQATPVRVLTLNVWLDCKGGLPEVADVIRRSQADVVGLQEADTCPEPLGEMLGFRVFRQDGDRTILSRFPIERTTPNRNGAVVRLPNGRSLAVFNAHLLHTPYQPFQLLGIPYNDAPFLHTEGEAQAASRQARGAQVEALLAELPEASQPAVVTGDFNEPSHLDWTQRAVEIGRHPLKVEWPSTRAFADADFRDSYRELFPDEIDHPGFTWTPRTAPDDPHDHHDRLDFVLYRGDGLEPRQVRIVGEKQPEADLVVSPYPTDHRGVVTEFEVSDS